MFRGVEAGENVDPGGEDQIAAGKDELPAHVRWLNLGPGQELGHERDAIVIPYLLLAPADGLSGPQTLGQVSVERSGK